MPRNRFRFRNTNRVQEIVKSCLVLGLIPSSLRSIEQSTSQPPIPVGRAGPSLHHHSMPHWADETTEDLPPGGSGVADSDGEEYATRARAPDLETRPDSRGFLG